MRAARQPLLGAAAGTGGAGRAAVVRRAHWPRPLFLALALIEFVDLFCSRSIRCRRSSQSRDPFIVYTSNIFAILGLRALYFALAAMIHRFRYLKYALAIVLVFIGSKIFPVTSRQAAGL